MTEGLAQPPLNHPFFSKLRSAERKNTDLRIVVDLKKPVNANSLQITTDPRTGHQVMVSFTTPVIPVPKVEKTAEKKAVVEEASTKQPDLEAQNTESKNLETDTKAVETNKELVKKGEEIVIAIDAGHGGVDAGAHGPNGTLEKKVVFAIAKRLEQLVNTQPDMRAVMVRKGDYYIKLRDRMDIARVAKADLFVSIHADAIHDASVKGASVYMLSNNGASSEAARWLANNENSADLIGGVSLEDKDDVLASVLLDLSQSATKEASRSVASKILKYFNAIGKLHKNEVQKASFMVLKSPDIPSILIETAFISNPDEELELRSVEHQEKIATAVFKGIASYFKEYAPAGTRMASSQ